jgi:hypothetical protein
MDCPIEVLETVRKEGRVYKAMFLGKTSDVVVTVCRSSEGYPVEVSRKPASISMMSYHKHCTQLTPLEYKKYLTMRNAIFQEKRNAQREPVHA